MIYSVYLIGSASFDGMDRTRHGRVAPPGNLRPAREITVAGTLVRATVKLEPFAARIDVWARAWPAPLFSVMG